MKLKSIYAEKFIVEPEDEIVIAGIIPAGTIITFGSGNLLFNVTEGRYINRNVAETATKRKMNIMLKDVFAESKKRYEEAFWVEPDNTVGWREADYDVYDIDNFNPFY